MPNPTPTKEEKDRALKWALTDTYAMRSEAACAQRVLLHATAELARAEERIRGLRLSFTRLNRDSFFDGAQDMRNDARDALDRDDKLARGEQETKMDATGVSNLTLTGEPLPPPKFTPKPGERVVLVSSPDDGDAHLVGKTLLIKAREDSPHPSCYWLVEDTRPDSCDETEFSVHREAVFAPAPAPAQAEQPPAVASGVAAVGYDTMVDIWNRHWRDRGFTQANAVEMLTEAYNLRAAEVAELKRELTEERVALELVQGTVTRRLILEARYCDDAHVARTERYVRIEREEREKAGRP